MIKNLLPILVLVLSSISMELYAQNVGIGTNTPTEKIHVVGNARITVLSGVGTRMVVADANGVLGTQAIPAGGDITSVTAGNGLIGGGVSGAVTITADADNGLYVNAGADKIRLGGPLVEATSITHNNFTLTHNLSGSGDFLIQDNGTNTFLIRDDGIAFQGDDMYWRDGNTGGTNLMSVVDGGSGNDGVLNIYRDNAANHIINGAGLTVFNENSFDQNFRVESNGNATMLFVDGGVDRVGIGTATLTQTLDIDGNADVNSGTYFVRDLANATYGIGYATEGGAEMTIFADQFLDFTESDANTLTMRMDLNAREVGIRTNAPTRALDVNGTVRIRGGAPNTGDLLMAQDANGNATWSNAGYGMVPIGSIIAWHGNIGGGIGGLPPGWVECVGGTVNNAASPINGRPIPNLNNNTTSKSGDASRGRFLRGSTISGQLQTDESNNFQQYHQDDSDGGPNNVTETIDDDGNWTQFMGDLNSNDRMRFRAAGVETRVTNMSVRWIMRVQ
ncbi:MAG: hypothetical protein GY810_07480 [Aureispira sp.]|nr:hypothetical protein [Aureispira sp.]